MDLMLPLMMNITATEFFHFLPAFVISENNLGEEGSKLIGQAI
jgi:hypothetical protein